MGHNKEIDHATGVETTGHVWDGDLKELNKPLPRWWLYTFYATIVWAIGYWIAYPAWPLMNGYTKGMLGYSQRQEVMQEVAAGKAAQAQYRTEVEKAAIADIAKNPELLRFATASGAAAFAANCAPCHGRGAQGANGYPNLNDDDWLWGGSLDAIQQSITHGIRSEDTDTRSSAMPRFGLDQVLDEKQISDAAEYVLSLSGKSTDKEAAARGATIFADNCAVCHGEKGTGNQELGAPNLTDAIWLYGGDKADVMQTIKTGRGGIMPQWHTRLDPVTIKTLAIYVHGLGGGK
ncbi:MAG: cytochrome-c oxidase, cbb3-type subunit III [Hyphomicrobiaceae bacterium]